MSKKEKSSFVFYYEWEQCFQALTNAELGRLLRVILAYEIRGERPEKLPGKLLICFDFVRGALDRNREKYEETCAKRRENGKKGGRPPKEPNGFSENQMVSKKAEPDPEREQEREYDPDREPGREPEEPSSRPGIVPAKQEVVDFFAREGLKGDPGRFYHFYQGRNWRTKHGRPIFWQDRARDWDREERAAQPSALPRATQPAVDEGYLAEIAQFRRAQGELA